MTAAVGPRGRRRGERGLTLIEMLVTIAVLSVGFLAILSAFAVLERQSASTTDDTQLTVVARQVNDVMQAQSFPYVTCAGPAGQAPSGTTNYQTKVRSMVTAASDTISVTAVAQAQAAGSSHSVNGGAAIPLVPISSCATAGTGSSADYGVQRISFTISSAQGHSISRVVYKRWD